jgi:hypothetical protein
MKIALMLTKVGRVQRRIYLHAGSRGFKMHPLRLAMEPAPEVLELCRALQAYCRHLREIGDSHESGAGFTPHQV